ncbi:MAG: iron-containing alcohol dehydrogenase family protein [Lachnospiraceae bacterium]|nr:iron-containing alcohol dehydrogenase family protein [Lachnospiraceae bacterium]
MNLRNGSYIAIPSILNVGSGILKDIGPTLMAHELDKVVIFFGNGLIGMFGETVLESMSRAGIEVLSYCELDDVNIDEITSIAFTLPNTTKAVIGIGGGKVIDAAKYMGFLRQMPFISVPTSSSSDGFSSASASLLVDGRKTTVPAAMAYGIIVDTYVLKTAPERFLYSGIGDMVAKITAVYDWFFEVEHGVGRINDMAVMIAKKAVNSFVRTPFKDIHENLFLKELVDSLAMSGIANEIAGGSAPTSGSEHLISHALDKYSEHPNLHGVQVGIATLIMAIVQEHRDVRVRQILTDTGFLSFCETQNLDVNDYLDAIDRAPSMKPARHTYLHEEKYRARAKEVLLTDPDLKRVFHLT